MLNNTYHQCTTLPPLIFLLLLLFISSVQAQSQVVYLKNGSRIKGKVTQDSTQQRIQVRTADGSVWTFGSEEVEKTEKVKVSRGYVGIIETGALTGKSSPNDLIFTTQKTYKSNFTVQSFNGYRFTPDLVTGATIGLDWYESMLLLPISASIRGQFWQSRLSMFYNLDLGWSTANFTREESNWTYQGGFMFSLGTGITIDTGNGTAFLLGIGYKAQDATATFADQWRYTANKYHFERVYIRTGFSF